MAKEKSKSSAPEPATLRMDKGTAKLAEIVLFVDGQTHTAGILEFAGMLAQEHSARLISIFMQPEPLAHRRRRSPAVKAWRAHRGALSTT